MSLVTSLDSKRIDAILEPVTPQNPAGLFDEEDEIYQEIDQEMVKMGGLHEARIDWPYVEEQSERYLSNQCKHLRIAGHLITAWLRRKDWSGWVESTELLSGMIAQYWETCYPKPGAKGFPGKRKSVNLILERLYAALDALDPASYSKEMLARSDNALSRLIEMAAETRLDQAQLERLLDRMRKASGQATFPQPPQPQRSAQDTGGHALNTDFFTTASSLPLGNERESRRTLLTIADHINQQDIYDPSGYQLRRFALWGYINSAPMIKRDNRTELQCVPQDIVETYLEALNSNHIDPQLLQRVEKSAVSSPFWIQGSYLAASIASRLEMKEVAAAIRQSTQRFVRRIPLLIELQFHDGRPFVDAVTHDWISGPEPNAAPVAAVVEYSGLREELTEQLEQEGVEVVLQRLQQMQTSFKSPRQHCHATVIAADLLSARGLTWLAKDLYTTVARTMSDIPACEWEPDLYGHLQQEEGPLWITE